MSRTIFLFTLLIAAIGARAQSLGNAGTITGNITDPSGAIVAGAKIEIHNPVTSYDAKATSDANGAFRIDNIPPNNYTLKVTLPGFADHTESIQVKPHLPMTVNIAMQLSSQVQTVNVEASGVMIENDSSAHTDVDRSQMLKLPSSDPAGDLSSAITYSTGGVAADANGFFHPMGDHAQVSFVIDGQTISDQQSKVFSTQLPSNALESMELITGSPDAEFGDKSSLVVSANTRSGLGTPKAFGNIETDWGSFGNWGGNTSLGLGSEKFGNFISLDGSRSGRFLDTPEFLPIHDVGNDERIFDRFDYQPDGQDVFHLDLFTARNWFQIPNSYDQLAQDQRQRVMTWNIAPGYQHTVNAHTLITVNAFARRDQVDYYGSRNPFDDTPVAVSQDRFLTNYGIKADISHQQGIHDIKVGVQIQQTRLDEKFVLGVTDPLYNAICVNASGDPLALPGVLNPNACPSVNPTYTANPNLQPGLIPYDLTRGGNYFNFHGAAHVNQYAFYIQDTINLHNWTFSVGIRDDQYNGLSEANGIQPRVSISYLVKPTGTVLRVGYSRTFETPFNENLILSSGTGAGGLAENVFGAASDQPLKPGNRNQFNTGLQQKLGSWGIVDADYFWKYTHNAYDFDVLFNTPITFPIAWHNSKIDGVTARVSTVNLHGFQAYVNLGHTRARYFPPEDGGLIPQGPQPTGVFRIDHDQAFEQTTNLRYQRPNNGAYISFIWRYDSGLVDSSVPDLATAFALTAAEQAAIGLYCGNTFATLNNPITSCSTTAGATRIRIPAPGTENDDTNPPRIAPRNLLDVSVGSDNLLQKKEKDRVTVAFSVTNLTNTISLYNFLSTFSGTHFVEPRAYQLKLGYVF